MANAKDDWKVVAIETLPEDTQVLWHEMKDAYKAYAAAKAAFEGAMQDAHRDALPGHLELKFGYMFGKLSIAIGPKVERKAKAVAAPRESLGSWIDAQLAGGRRS